MIEALTQLTWGPIEIVGFIATFIIVTLTLALLFDSLVGQ